MKTYVQRYLYHFSYCLAIYQCFWTPSTDLSNAFSLFLSSKFHRQFTHSFLSYDLLDRLIGTVSSPIATTVTVAHFYYRHCGCFLPIDAVVFCVARVWVYFISRFQHFIHTFSSHLCTFEYGIFIGINMTIRLGVFVFCVFSILFHQNLNSLLV